MVSKNPSIHMHLLILVDGILPSGHAVHCMDVVSNISFDEQDGDSGISAADASMM